MIEYYTFMHKGGEDVYNDNIYLNYSPNLMFLVYYGSRNGIEIEDKFESVGRIISGSRDKSFDEVSNMIAEFATESSNYLLAQINDSSIRTERHGDVIPYIVKDGEIKNLPNGVFGLEDNDQIICGTSRFFEKLSKLALLSDALTAYNCEEWMDNLVCRISEQNMLVCGNLTAINLIVRKDD